MARDGDICTRCRKGTMRDANITRPAWDQATPVPTYLMCDYCWATSDRRMV